MGNTKALELAQQCQHCNANHHNVILTRNDGVKFCQRCFKKQDTLDDLRAQLAERDQVISTLTTSNKETADVLLAKLQEAQATVDKLSEQLAERDAQLAAAHDAMDFAIGSLRHAQIYVGFNNLGTIPSAIFRLEKALATRQPTQDKGGK